MAYNPNFSWKRKTVTITKGTDLPAGYQVKLVIAKEAEMQADFRNIRFETTDGYGLPYWIESVVSTTATVWVKLKDALTTATVDIYMYYGNGIVASASNGANTFDFFDDFNDGSINAIWQNTANWTESGGYITFPSSTGTEGRLWINTPSNDYIVQAKIRPNAWGDSSYKHMGLGTRISSGTTNTAAQWFCVVYDDATKVDTLTSTVGWKTPVSSGFTFTLGSWYNFAMRTNLANNTTVWGKAWVVGGSEPAWQMQSEETAVGNKNLGLIMVTNGGASYDDFRVRKYVATEPATPTFSGLTTVNWNPQRKPILITGTTPADYQIKLTVTHAMEMNVDYSDLRFVSDSGTSLSYWIESYTSNEATVWVKIPAITTSGYIYMHYGNPNLTSTSNGSNVFIQWHGAATASYEDANVVSIPFIWESYIYMSGADTKRFGVTDVNTFDANDILFYTWTNTDINIQSRKAGAMLQTALEGAATSGWRRMKAIATSTSVEFSYTGQSSATYSMTDVSKIPIVSMGLVMTSGATGQQTFSFARKYVVTEPTIDQTAASESMNTFSRRKKLTINNNSDGALTDYQVPVTVTYAASIQPDFDDIRFVDANNNLLPYWIESKTDSSTANVWIKTNLSTGNNTVYMYYGNANLTSASDGNNTFDFFDDFSSDLSKWDYTSTVSIISGELKISSGSWEASAKTKASFARPIIFEWKERRGTSSEGATGYVPTLTWSGSVDVLYYQNVGSWLKIYTDNNAYGSGVAQNTNTNKFRLTLLSTGSNVYMNNSVFIASNSVKSTTPQYFGFFDALYSPAYLDDVHARKYVANESTAITVSTGLEQTPVGITADSMTISKSENPCRTGFCTVTVDVVWRNDSAVPESFIPSIKINTVPAVVDPPLTSVTVDPAGTKSQQFIIPNLPANTYSICPDPN